VQKYIEIFKRAKLELSALDTESFALIRSLIGKDKSSILLVDMGSSRSNITIVEKGIPFFTRSVDMGGRKMTQSLMQQMGLEEEDAEQMKRDLSHGNSSSPSLPKAFEGFLEPLLNEMHYSLEHYIAMDVRENHEVEKVILTGGSAHLPGIATYFANALNLNVYIGDPWARLLYPEDLRPVLHEIGPRLSVAIGLAMRENEV
jgi:type IV pilus assembly protein PilM